MDVTRITLQNCHDPDRKDFSPLNTHVINKKKACNKRKRRLTSEEKETHNGHEPKRRYLSAATSSSQPILPSCSSDRSSPLSSPMAGSASEMFIVKSSPSISSIDDDLSLLTECEYRSYHHSPDNSSIDAATSPASSSCHSTTIASGTSWHKRGDVTPHGKKRCRRILNYIETVPQCCITPTVEARPCPLPALSWANALDVWKVMCRKDEQASINRSANMLENHSGLQPRMRAILLDWLIEVCEVYKLHRETYHLAIDYLDRYLTSSKMIQKTHLQLIGITCLFVAAKVEEIYPPKIGEFAYVTDGACQEEDILQQELLLLKALDWSISPVTILGWLGVYMQLNVSNRTPSSFINRNVKINSKEENSKSSQSTSTTATSDRLTKKRKHDRTDTDVKKPKLIDSNSAEEIVRSKNVDDAFIYPQFSGLEFVQIARLVDLCSLDVGIAKYSYSVIAAAAISHTFSRETAERLSGLDWKTISPCAQWMEPFFDITHEESQHLFLLEQNEQVKSKFGLGHVCPNIVTDDSHIIQTHSTSIDMFDKALMRRDFYLTSTTHSTGQETSPAIPAIWPEDLLTPPASSRKPTDVDSESDTHI